MCKRMTQFIERSAGNESLGESEKIFFFPENIPLYLGLKVKIVSSQKREER